MTWLLICWALFLQASNDYIDSLKQEIKKHENADTNKVKMLNRLSFAYRSIDPKETERLGFEALELARELDYEQGMGNAYQFIAISYWFRGDYEKAHDYLDKSIRVHKELEDLVGLGQNYLNQGNIYHSQGNFKEALSNYFNALKYARKIGDQWMEGKCLNNIGNVYYSQQALNKAVEYYQKSLKIRKHLNDQHGIAKCLNNIGNVYSDQGKIAKARQHLQRSLGIKKELNDKTGIAHTLNNLGVIEKTLGAYQQALNYFHRSLAIKKEIGNDEGLVQTMNNIGHIYFRMGRLDTSKYYLKHAKNKAVDIGAEQLELESYGHLISTDSAMGNFKEAFLWQQKYTKLKDSLSSVEKSKEMAAIEAKYQTAKKEAQLRKSRQKIYLLGGGLVLVILLAAVFILHYRSKQRSARLKAEKHEALATKRQNELEKQKKERELNSLIQGQEMERKRIGEELHDGLGARLASLKLNIANNLTHPHGEQQNGNSIKKLEKEIDDVCQEVRTISHNLMPPALLQNSLSDAIYDYINEANYTQPNLKIECDLFSEATINQLERELQMSIYRIIQELVNNVIKHAEATEVHLQIVPHEGNLNILVEDNGKGFDPDEHQEGVGLSNVQSRVNLLNGQLKIDSNKHNGTLLNLNIPISNYATA